MKTLDSTKQQIIEQLDHLSQEQLDEVLAFVKRLNAGQSPQSFSPEELIGFFRQFSFTQEEKDEMPRILKEMRRA